MRFRVLMLLVGAAVFAGTAACDEALSDLTGPTPNLEPTFSSGMITSASECFLISSLIQSV